jgi:hypothetical protein
LLLYESTGTCQQTIGYVAGGTSIDWFYSAHDIMAFVAEIPLSCDQRWCPHHVQESLQVANQYALSAVVLVDLTIGDEGNHHASASTFRRDYSSTMASWVGHEESLLDAILDST